MSERGVLLTETPPDIKHERTNELSALRLPFGVAVFIFVRRLAPQLTTYPQHPEPLAPGNNRYGDPRPSRDRSDRGVEIGEGS